MAKDAEILVGNCLEVLATLPAQSVHCCVTSPPYWGLRDYGIEPVEWPAVSFSPVAGLPVLEVPAQAAVLGLEADPWAFVGHLVLVFREVRRVLRDDGCLWLNLGDSYARAGGEQGGVNRELMHMDGTQKRMCRIPDSSGLKPKDLCGIPWRAAFALQADGWYLRQENIWAKKNSMPESVRDRPSKSHEQVFQFAKSKRYFFDMEAVREKATGGQPGNKTHRAATAYQEGDQKHRTKAGLVNMVASEKRSLRSVWHLSSETCKEAHFATFPQKLIIPCIKASTSERGCCPSCGAQWKRIVERERVATRPGNDTKVTGDTLTDGNRDPQRHVSTTKTTGWEPSCDCGRDDTEPPTVLDPFNGAGTSGVVSRKLGCRYIGIEVNPEYAAMSRKRIRDDAPLFNS